PAKDANVRMVNLMRTLHKQTGKRVVVLCDEYDNFILHAMGDNEKVAQARQRFQNVFGPLKAEDDHLQFAFITGISKFSQMGIFSKLNNLKNISMRNDFASICGISEQELTTQLRPDIELMAQRNGTGYDEMLTRLKSHYDGYHFSEDMEDMYNPFSLFNALDAGSVNDYWFDRGTSSALIDMLAQMPPVEVAELESIRLPSTAFDLPFDSFDDPLPVLYQSGYLTIKDCKKYGFDIIFTLGFPNAEVRKGFAECLFRHVAGKKVDSRKSSALQLAYYDFRETDDLPAFIEAIKTFFASIPYQWEKDNRNEHYYHALLYTLLTSFGADVRAEEPTAKGQTDLTLLMPRGIYVMEIKYDHTAQEALDQITRKGYAEKYRLDGSPVTKVGISFSSEERNITDWKQEKAYGIRAEKS
ncbi:MAG: AAA family ATPase, partial [Prevotella sp.]|nr:AAA family ATPase [Prevotella sp.]